MESSNRVVRHGAVDHFAGKAKGPASDCEGTDGDVQNWVGYRLGDLSAYERERNVRYECILCVMWQVLFLLFWGRRFGLGT